MRQFSQLTQRAGRPEIRALRNFPVEAFSDGDRFIQDTVTAWLQYNLANIQEQPLSDIVKVIEEAIEAKSRWGEAFQASISDALREFNSVVAHALWTWWVASPKLIVMLEDYIPQDNVTEDFLSAACPTALPPNVGEKIIDVARSRSWLSLHARTLLAYMPWRQALEMHLLVDVSPRHSVLVEFLCSRANSTEILEAAYRLNDARLDQVAAKRIVDEPRLKAGVDIKDARWRDIWLASIQLGVPPLSGFDMPEAIFATVLDCIVKGDAVNDVILRELVTNENIVDLCDYPGRERLWPLLSEHVRNILLTATATGWYRRFEANLHPSFTPDPELKSKIFERSVVSHWLLKPASRAVLMTAFLEQFSDYPDPENLLIEWITSHPRVRHVDALAIGSLIRERRWRATASRLVTQVHDGYSDWEPAVEECAELLSILQRVTRSFRKDKRVEAEDWWNAWVELAASLYPTGVRDRNIWTRSWGDLSRIDVNRDGRSQWQEALSLLGNGIERITVEGLLHQMRVDWDNNRQLEILEKAWLKKRVS